MLSVYGKSTHKGKFLPKYVHKYIGDVHNVVYRSSWELKLFKWCDTNQNVLKWSSEEVRIPYISPIDGKPHTYYVDVWMEVKDTSGKIKRYLIEVKPEKFTQPPQQPKRKTKRYIAEVFEYGKNQAKWEAAKAFCTKRGWEFIILTERQLAPDRVKPSK